MTPAGHGPRDAGHPIARPAPLLVDDLPTAEDVVPDAFAALPRRHGRRLASLDDPRRV